MRWTMTTIPVISQLKSLFQAVTGDEDGAKKTQDEFVDAWIHHPLKTVGDLADGIPVVGHIKGFVHLALGDKEGFIHSEEAASRTSVVLAAAALTGASGGLAAPVLAGVVAGVAADGIFTGIESARHGKYDPQGLVGVGTNVVKGIEKGEKINGDIFDGIAIVASDGVMGSSGFKPKVKTTTLTAVERQIYRVEGRSLWRFVSKEGVESFKSGDNQRIFPHKEEVFTRRKLPGFRDAEELTELNPPSTDPAAPPADAEPAGPADGEEPGPSGGKKEKDRGDTDRIPLHRKIWPNVFEDDDATMMFLNFGNEDRAYSYWAQKAIDHREVVEKYRTKNPGTAVKAGSHSIKIKTFKVFTRDLEQAELDSITEDQKADLDRMTEEQRAEEGVVYKGVIRVDLKAERQYGLEPSRYAPIIEKTIKGSFAEEVPWLDHLPTGILKLIRDHPAAAGKVRRFAPKAPLAGSAAVTGEGASNSTKDHLGPVFLPIRYLMVANADDMEIVEDTPEAILHCRHVKVPVPATDELYGGWTEHFEYLVKFTDGKLEWYPGELIADDLKENYQKKTTASAKPVARFAGQEGDKIIVEREDGSTEKVDHRQIFWEEQEDGTEPLHLKELDGIIHHLRSPHISHGQRIPMTAAKDLPAPHITRGPVGADVDGKPLYLASALNFNGGIHPCEVAPDRGADKYRVAWEGKAVAHDGEFDFLPFTPESMEFVPSKKGAIPDGRVAILGGHDAEKKTFYHALADIDGHKVPGKAAPHLNGGQFLSGDSVVEKEDCEIL
ncbi:Delta(24)-sterol C-methyltransferase [Drechslerella dactyloides]|uniref:Delta(24)-sterol C-methyltransferase n=1 Tax=Drechslerella dactyloides TaxID=74499 RepID=A0AAD6NLY9_DREDA|nr:Delta(24)-sterol C-methyltransferase [Drechslerella dactyloides]